MFISHYTKVNNDGITEIIISTSTDKSKSLTKLSDYDKNYITTINIEDFTSRKSKDSLILHSLLDNGFERIKQFIINEENSELFFYLAILPPEIKNV